MAFTSNGFFNIGDLGTAEFIIKDNNANIFSLRYNFLFLPVFLYQQMFCYRDVAVFV